MFDIILNFVLGLLDILTNDIIKFVKTIIKKYIPFIKFGKKNTLSKLKQAPFYNLISFVLFLTVIIIVVIILKMIYSE